MTLTLRSASTSTATTKGAVLTHAEMDANWLHVLQSANQSFLQSGTGAIAESMQSRERWFGYVTDYLSDANRASLRAGSTVDIAAALTSALAEHAVVLIPAYDDYTLGSKVTVPTNKGIFGFNKLATTITKAFNGDMIDLSAHGSFLEGVYLAGAGATFTGKGILIGTAAAGKQRIHRCRIDDTDGACIDFSDKDAGSQFSGFDLDLNRRNSGTGTGRYAVTISATQQLTATPRKFTQVETQGGCSFDFGGCANTYISDSTIGDVNYTADSRSVHIVNTRLLNQASLTINGFNNTIVSGSISPNITIASGAGDNVIGPCSFNGTITDSSGLGTNQIFHTSVNYTPTWTASVNPAIGDGTITGHYSRTGDVITATISIAMGSTTTFGTGEYSFSLPQATLVTGRNFVGSVQGLDSGTAYLAGACRLSSGGSTVQCYHHTGATAFSPTVPITWANGDLLNMTITYSL